MSLASKTLKLCSCNGTLAIDGRRLGDVLKTGKPVTVHRELCRKEAGAFQAALSDPDVIVACTQEASLFGELASAAQSQARISFLNIREAAGWSAEGAKAMPKIAALLAAAGLPEPEPVPQVDYKSDGQLLIIGPAEAALDWAARLEGQVDVCVLLTGRPGGELPAERRYPVWSGKVTGISGWLGAFEVEWQQENAIDLELCTRCNACVQACPEGAIGLNYQVDMEKCKSHRDCVKACGAIGAIDFSREVASSSASRKERFDLVLDLSRQPLIRLPDLPQGYAAPGADPLEQAFAVPRLVALVGEFSKPRFTQYRERICAHGRSGKTGCTQCLDVCSTGAISADGDKVKVEPHLCAGCGGCATVCPSGAMTHSYPSVPELGARLKLMLATFREAGGRDACVLVHDPEQGRELVRDVGRRAGFGARGQGARGAGRGLPARVIPFEVFHVASVGMDLLLGAICYGASQVRIALTGREPDGYVAALNKQMGFAAAIMKGLGYEGEHFGVLEAENLESQLWELVPAQAASLASFNLSAEKRTSLDFAFEHLAKGKRDAIPLPAGAPFGAITVNKDTCTLCKACIGACPEAALLDSPEAPTLRFIERNCVQCGLCEKTCPENAIKLVPQLLLGAQAKEAVTLNEAEPFNCLRCGKPFGTRQMMERMTGKLGAHSMFAGGGALKRLQMCGDCRVVDMMDNKGEATIHDFPRT